MSGWNDASLKYRLWLTESNVGMYDMTGPPRMIEGRHSDTDLTWYEPEDSWNIYMTAENSMGKNTSLQPAKLTVPSRAVYHKGLCNGQNKRYSFQQIF